MENIGIEVFLAVCIVLILVEVVFVYKNIKANTWEKTRGVIIEDDVNLNWNALMVTKLVYKFTISGIEYKSDNVAYATLGSIFTILKDRYIKSDEVTVYYQLGKPSKSVLVPGFRLFHFIHFTYLCGFLLFFLNEAL